MALKRLKTSRVESFRSKIQARAMAAGVQQHRRNRRVAEPRQDLPFQKGLALLRRNRAALVSTHLEQSRVMQRRGLKWARIAVSCRSWSIILPLPCRSSNRSPKIQNDIGRAVETALARHQLDRNVTRPPS